jgi:hypothetical protein
MLQSFVFRGGTLLLPSRCVPLFNQKSAASPSMKIFAHSLLRSGLQWGSNLEPDSNVQVIYQSRIAVSDCF